LNVREIPSTVARSAGSLHPGYGIMAFIVRATDKVGDIGWIQPPNNRGSRAIGPRSTAERFADRESAENAVASLPAIYGEMGLKYTVEKE
jgi:hypothetical protein